MDELFSTQDLAAKDRFDYWHEVVCRVYAHCQGSVDVRNGFTARTEVRKVGAAEMSDVVSTPIRYERRKYDLRSGPSDDIFVSLMLDGAGEFTQNGKELPHCDGDILIYDAGRPYSYLHKRDYRSILLRVPRPALEARLTQVDDLGGILLKGGSTYGRLVGSLIRDTFAVASDEDVHGSEELGAPTLDVVAAAVRWVLGDRKASTRHASLLAKIQRTMRENLTDQSQSLEKVARDQNVSMRTLSRLFAGQGFTPMGWLHAQRLAWAYTALSEKKITSVTEVAFAAGFNDLSHFSRSFKKAYGRTPNTLLPRH